MSSGRGGLDLLGLGADETILSAWEQSLRQLETTRATRPVTTPGHVATGRNPLTKGFLRIIPLECYLKAAPESGFIWKR